MAWTAKLRERASLEACLAALAGLLVLLLLAEEVPRVAFPWDLRSFAESPFMTDMLKLTAGGHPYASPDDCNSFIYAPGLEYLTFALLRPFHAQLDIRFCRAVTVAVGLAASWVAGHLVARFVTVLRPGPVPRWMRAVATCSAALLVFKNFTADACHPDNLWILHAMAVIALCDRAIQSERFSDALVAIGVAALGVAAKQTGALGLVGALAIVIAARGRRFGLVRTAILPVLGVALSGAIVAFAFGRWGRYWAFELVSNQQVEWERFYQLIHHYTSVPYRLALTALFAPCAIYVGLKAKERGLLGAWLAIGVTEVLPALASYFKIYAWWNNLVIVDVWMSLPVVAALLHAMREARESNALAPLSAAAGVIATLLVSLVPTRVAPRYGEYQFGRALDAALSADKAAGRRVLVTHGASALIRAGYLEVPLDRALTAAELENAHAPAPAASRARFADRAYDRIYWLGPAYSDDVRAAISANYREIGFIPRDNPALPDSDMFAVHSYMHEGVRILEAIR